MSLFQKAPTKREKLPAMTMRNVQAGIVFSINEQDKSWLKIKVALLLS